MGFPATVAIGIGAAIGAWLRWAMDIFLNPIFPSLPLGTLAANLLGGLLMGIAMEVIARHTALPVELRLGFTTGFLGGLTTFSTFSAETTTLLLHQQYLWGATIIVVHVTGSVAMTVAGIIATRAVLLRRRTSKGNAPA